MTTVCEVVITVFLSLILMSFPSARLVVCFCCVLSTLTTKWRDSDLPTSSVLYCFLLRKQYVVCLLFAVSRVWYFVCLFVVSRRCRAVWILVLAPTISVLLVCTYASLVFSIFLPYSKGCPCCPDASIMHEHDYYSSVLNELTYDKGLILFSSVTSCVIIIIVMLFIRTDY